MTRTRDTGGRDDRAAFTSVGDACQRTEKKRGQEPLFASPPEKGVSPVWILVGR